MSSSLPATGFEVGPGGTRQRRRLPHARLLQGIVVDPLRLLRVPQPLVQSGEAQPHGEVIGAQVEGPSLEDDGRM